MTYEIYRVAKGLCGSEACFRLHSNNDAVVMHELLQKLLAENTDESIGWELKQTVDYPRLQVGDYVKVIKEPESWEGNGESPEDRVALIGHVGIIVEDQSEIFEEDSLMMYLIRFPGIGVHGTFHPPYGGVVKHIEASHVFGQRCIEGSALQFVSRPAKPITDNLFEEGGL